MTLNYSNGNGNHIVRMVEERKPGILGVSLNVGRRRALDLSHELTRRGAHKAAAELINEAVCHFIEICYERDETGYTFIDDKTGVLEKRPSPWGRQYRRFGLCANERAVLKLYVDRLSTLHRPSPLFCYDPISKRWGVDIFTYTDEAAALHYWTIVQLDSATFKHLLTEVRTMRKGNA